MDKLMPRQEKFCQYYVLYVCSAVAAREAGYKPQGSRRQGYRLLQEPRIRERICEIQATMAREQCRDRDVMLGKLEAVYRRAMNDHHYHAAARAVEVQARISGLYSRMAVKADGEQRRHADAETGGAEIGTPAPTAH